MIDYCMQQLILILDGFCSVGMINFLMVMFLFGEMKDDGCWYVLDSSYVFKFGSSYNEV